MSDKISYILEVLDNYSVNTRKFRKEIGSVESSIKSLNTNLTKTTISIGKIGAFSELGKLSSQLNNVASSINKVNRANIQSSNISRQSGRVSKRTFAGAYTPIKFDPYEGKYVGRPKPDPSAMGYGVAGLMGRGLGPGNIAAGLGFAGAAYTVGRSVKYVHDTTVQMDSLRASLSALIPKVKGLEGATPESEIQYLRGVSNKYGLSFNDISPSYTKILGTGGKIDASLAKGLIENIGGYSGLLGLSGPATQDTLRGFQDMLTKQVLQAQEVNLQMQQLPGVKPMLHKAFFRIAQRQGDKRVTMENASQEFQKSMGTGKLSSALMLRELVKVIEEEFGQKMLEKANKLGNEERRLASATQELATTLGDLAYPATIGAVRGMNTVVKGVNSFIGDLQASRDTLGDFFNNKQDERNKDWLNKLRQENPDPYGLGLTGNIIGKGFTAANEVAKLPVNTFYEGAMGAISGDWSGISKPMKEFNDYFGFTDVINSINSLTNAILGQNQNKQQVEVKISAENLPDVFNVQTNQPNMSMWRPSTVIAGQR